MKQLSRGQDKKIRNTLDYIAESLHHEEVLLEDLAWAHHTILELLFVIDGLQEEINRGKKIE